MNVLSLVKTVWECAFKDLILVGKVLFFIPLVLISILMFLPAVLEFFVIDSTVFFVLLFLKSLSPKDFIEFLKW